MLPLSDDAHGTAGISLLSVLFVQYGDLLVLRAVRGRAVRCEKIGSGALPGVSRHTPQTLTQPLNLLTSSLAALTRVRPLLSAGGRLAKARFGEIQRRIAAGRPVGPIVKQQLRGMIVFFASPQPETPYAR